MKGSTKNKVFVSYSWTSPAHQRWVQDLAERLTADGIYVIVDEWDLKPGHDKYVFMEKMVTDPGVSKVLVICDGGYQQKADGRKGGVGTESQLISQEVYEKVDQEKFIPIIAERDEAGEPCMPKYIASRIYFDLSTEAKFEKEYQRLLLNLYGKPEKKRPPLGEPPAYITEDTKSTPKAASVLRAAQLPVAGVGASSSVLIGEFFDQFLPDMEEFRFQPVQDEQYDETMVKIIERMRPLRDAFITFAHRIARSGLSDEDLDLFRDHLGKLAQFQFRPYGLAGAYREVDWDNYRFFSYEVMIYLVAILLRNGRFREIAGLVNATYFYTSSEGQTAYRGVNLFDEYASILEEVRNQRLKLNRVSVTADMVKSRAEGSGLGFDELLEADLLIHYVTLLNAPLDMPGNGFWDWRWNVWFPRISPYSSRSGSVPALEKMISARYFERAKILFNVKTPQELLQKIEQSAQKAQQYYSGMGFNYSVAMISSLVKQDTLASVP